MAGRMGGYAVGETIDDRYLVTAMVGHGGHGVVYAAVDEMLGAKVAVKCLNADLAEDPAFKLRMHREARAMGALSGTSAAQIFAFNRAKRGELYIVMELLAGRDLDDYLRELEKFGATLDIRRLVNLLTPIAETLDSAHELGIIHRDIKPGNIFVLDSMTRGGVRLLDFGLAKDLNAVSLTQDGMIAGSPGYIAPEIWRGRAKDADRRIDVYSFSAVVYRALTGVPPFDPKQPMDRFLLGVTRGERPQLTARRPDLPASIDEWTRKALAADPADRFATVGKMWSSLRAIAEIPVPSRAPSAPVSEPWEVEIDVDIDIEVASLRGTQLPAPTAVPRPKR
ncbi:MAG: serine/threonine protein kinase [Polyangiaceae bacterium]|nr:serine/threonine protein kinase [Polyangiaceae bacterium]